METVIEQQTMVGIIPPRPPFSKMICLGAIPAFSLNEYLLIISPEGPVKDNAVYQKGFFYDKHVSTDHTIEDIKTFLKESDLVKTNDYIINISSIPLNEKGKSNMIKLSVVE